MGTISRPGRSRHDSGRGILNFRGRDKELVAKELAKEKASKEGATKESKETGAKDMLNKEVGNKEAVTKDTPAKTTVKTEEKVCLRGAGVGIFKGDNSKFENGSCF